MPGRVTLAIAVSMPDVPVPDTANENAPSPAWNVAASCARMSSRIAIIAGSRWLRTGNAIARMTRSDTGLGPGPSRSRSATRDVGACGIEQAPDLVPAVGAHRLQGGGGFPPGRAPSVHAPLGAGVA